MEKAIKIVFFIIIAGIVLYVYRSGAVTKILAMTASSGSNASSSTSLIQELFPMPKLPSSTAARR
ncbi:MAG TPA: hypothetical protein VNG29_00475 [Candidatus Paceibacterota bacterium]|nr:hypothetical protein [Candidatus Paceibacterota bacterium]